MTALTWILSVVIAFLLGMVAAFAMIAYAPGLNEAPPERRQP